MSSYAVVIERADDGGYGAWSPDLPGVAASGGTEAEALDEMRRAITRLREDGRAVPRQRRRCDSTRRDKRPAAEPGTRGPRSARHHHAAGRLR